MKENHKNQRLSHEFYKIQKIKIFQRQKNLPEMIEYITGCIYNMLI